MRTQPAIPSPPAPAPRRGIAALALGAAMLASGAAQATSYTITALPLAPGAVYAYGGAAINAGGQVVGDSYVGGNHPWLGHGFLWTPGAGTGSTQDLAPLGGFAQSSASAINASGQIAGYSFNTIQDSWNQTITTAGNATIWTPNGSGFTTTSIAPLAGDQIAEARGINASGQVVGLSTNTTTHASRVFLWTPGAGGGTTQDLTASLGGGNFTGSVAINASGQVLANNSTGAKLWTPSGSGGSVQSIAGVGYALNDLGWVTGYGGDGMARAFRWTPEGGMTLLDAPDGNIFSYYGWGLNTAGTVVGTRLWDSYEPVVWLNNQMNLLFDLVQNPTGWWLDGSEAYAINDAGWITGRGVYNGHSAAFLMTPVADVPEPATATLLGAGLLGLGLFRRRWAA